MCECKKAAVYELLRTKIVLGSAPVLTRYYEKDITRIISYADGEEIKLTKNVIGYDASLFYLYCSGHIMPCGKDKLIVNKKPFEQK